MPVSIKIHSLSGDAPTGELVRASEMPHNAVGIVEVSTVSSTSAWVGQIVVRNSNGLCIPFFAGTYGDRGQQFAIGSGNGQGILIRLLAPSEGVTILQTDEASDY